MESERLNETITGLLELAQVDMNFTQAALSPVAIDDLIWELQDYWTKKLGKNLFNVSILELPEDQESLSISANRSLLLIAFNNIIGNAFKFSNDQPVTCSLYADAHCIKVYISDLGIGILEEEKEKIFNSFFRGTNASSIRGNGIGLYVTSKIISLFNGIISLISKPGDGTTFVIEFIR
jgi:signal transduction histidine kinase